MSFVLTENSKLVCQHQGTMILSPSQSKLKVNGAAVLVDGDLAHATVNLCLTETVPPSPGPASVPCVKVDSVIGGVARRLKVQGKGVLLDDIRGVTNGVVAGVPKQPWSVRSAGETKLKAV